MTILFNLTSAVFALVCLALPLQALLRPAKPVKNYESFSFLFCAAAAIVQLMAVRAQVRAEDWAGLADTAGAAASLFVYLFTLMALLNVLAIRRVRASSAGADSQTRRKAKQ